MGAQPLTRERVAGGRHKGQAWHAKQAAAAGGAARANTAKSDYNDCQEAEHHRVASPYADDLVWRCGAAPPPRAGRPQPRHTEGPLLCAAAGIRAAARAIAGRATSTDLTARVATVLTSD